LPVKLERVRLVNVGAAPVLIFCMVSTAPEDTEKLVALNEAIPLAAVVASSMVMVAPEVWAFARVKAPVIALPPVPPTTLNTPVLVIVTAPVPWLSEIPVPATFEVTPVLERVSVPPKDTGEPDTPRPVPPETVILEF
jgi:hypothetical protein